MAYSVSETQVKYKKCMLQDLEPGKFFRFVHPVHPVGDDLYQKIVDESTSGMNETIHGYYVLKIGRVLHKAHMQQFWGSMVYEVDVDIKCTRVPA